jgi:predicted nucleotidyltransferase/biotin operon repressor
MQKSIARFRLADFDEAYQKTLVWYYSFPNAELGLSDLAREVGMSKTTANKIVERLMKEGFLVRKVYGKTWSISCDKSHPYNIIRKVPFNLSGVLEAYSGGMRKSILKVEPNPIAVVLFGSYSKGDDNDKSDIDIAVEVIGDKNMTMELGSISEFGYRKNVAINLHIFSRKTVDPNLFANIVNGMVIEGFLEARP